jgi:hypothetical protein
MEDIGEVKYTDEQLQVIKSMVEYAETFLNGLWHIMQNHGIDKVEGGGILLEINPESDLCTRRIEFGKSNSDAGFVELTRGRSEKAYVPVGTNSPEYEWLFADPAFAERMRQICKRAKPLPPDGLWIGDGRNDPPVDHREWDVNDSLS